ncbi:MAG: hypothetical protein JSR58_04050 [Verrucomicrobia bacterium]|nr:hypothetical protein [Verrucomicrobiota bacterium]
MSTTTNVFESVYPIQEEVESHPAWKGNITGLNAEDLLQDKPAFTFLIRKGEHPMNYYITFVQKDGSFKHQPLLIMHSPYGWSYRNSCKSVPTDLPFVNFIHLMMHCNKDECTPLS